MTRKQQDLASWAVAVAVLLSQVVLSLLGKPTVPTLIAGAFAMLGLPTVRKVQDAVNEEAENEKAKPAKASPVRARKPRVET